MKKVADKVDAAARVIGAVATVAALVKVDVVAIAFDNGVTVAVYKQHNALFMQVKHPGNDWSQAVKAEATDAGFGTQTFETDQFSFTIDKKLENGFFVRTFSLTNKKTGEVVQLKDKIVDISPLANAPTPEQQIADLVREHYDSFANRDRSNED